ncbi:thioesterase II family protein [Streptomyces violaceorubidus]
MHEPDAENRRWLRRYAPAEGAARRLVCFPHAGGSATFFTPLARVLAPGTDVLAVQYPGRQDRLDEACVDQIAPLADRITDTLAGSTDLPLAFFGHSMGAVVAFEVARRLRRAHQVRLTRLFVSGRRAPSRHRPSRVHSLADRELLAEVGALGGTDTRLLDDPGARAMILPAIRADYRAVETYRYEPGQDLDCPVSVLFGESDPQTARDDAAEWGRHTDKDVEVHMFPGGHFFLVDQAPRITGLLAEHLASQTEPVRSSWHAAAVRRAPTDR